MNSGQSIPHHLQRLRQQIDGLFKRVELEQIIFDLGIDSEHLVGPTKPQLIISLIQHTQQHDQFSELIAALQAARPGETWDFTAPAEPDASPPFKGLQYFTESDEAIFFGREALVAGLINHLKSHSFLAVVGASGSGKSSIVRAGVVPAVRQGAIKLNGKPSNEWDIHVVTPGSEPLKALAATLTRHSESVRAMKTLIQDMQADSDSLHLWLYRELAENDRHLLLIIDQFEELFTQCQDTDTRRLFVENLVNTVLNNQQRVTMIITLRADFYAYAVKHEPLRPLLEMRQKIVGGMSRHELERAIKLPAEAAKWYFQPGLVDTILSDVGSRENSDPEPGALPLLSHALLETWHRREGRTMTLVGYQTTGGVRKAIAKTADSVLAQMNDAERLITRNIFLRLTELGKETEATRRRTTFTELLPTNEEAGDIRTVLAILADARLVTTDEDLIEVAHEALIREWPILRQWLGENREGLQIHREITAAAKKWDENGREESYLYLGVRLERVLAGISDSSVALNAQEAAFLATCQEVETAVKQAREVAYQRELTQARQLAEAEQQRADIQTTAARRARRLTYGLAVAFLLAVGVLFFAARQLQVALARQLLTQAQVLVKEEDNLGLAALIALESRDLIESEETTNLLGEIPYAWPQFTGQRLAGHTSWVMSAAWSADGRLATGSEDGTVIIWDDLFGQPVHTFTDHEGIVTSVAWSPDGRLASGSGDYSVIVWNMESGKPDQTLRGHLGGIQSILWTDDGELVSASADQTIILWNMETGTAKTTFSGHSLGVLSIALSADGRLASGSADNMVKVWDIETGALLQTLSGHTESVWSVAWSPDGRLTSGSDDDTIIIWDLDSGQPDEIFHHTSNIISVGWSPDGRLTSGSTDSRVIIWDMATQTADQILTMHSSSILSVSWSADGRLATGAGDSMAIVWREAAGQTVDTYSDHIDWINSVAWSADGRLASGSGDKKVIIWDEAANQPLQTLSGHSDFIESVAWSADGRLASGSCHQRDYQSACTQGEIIIWDLTSETPAQTILEHTGIITSLAWSADGRLASGSDDGKVIVWNLTSPIPMQVLDMHTAGITNLAWSENGRLASGSQDGTAIVWDLTTRTPAQTLADHTAAVLDVAWSEDGRLATSSTDKSVIIWELDTGEPAQTLTGHTAAVQALSWSSDGRLASGASDGSTIIWDVAAEQPDQLLTANSDPIRDLDWSANGRLATGSSDRTVRVIPEVFTHPPCNWLNRNMTEAEWLTHMAPFAWSSSTAFETPASVADYLNFIFVSTYQPTCPNLPAPEVSTILTIQGRLLYGAAGLMGLMVVGMILWGMKKLVRNRKRRQDTA